MKKIVALVLTLSLSMAFAACGDSDNGGTTTGSSASTTPAATTTSAPASTDDPAVKSDGVMTYAEYAAAELDTEVVIEAYIQAKQGWWEKDGVGGVATFYTQDKDGAYFLYDMPCTKEDYDSKLVKGAKIKVTGFKAAFEGEVEIIDATYEVLEGNYVAEATDVTALLGGDELINNMNKFVSFKGMTVEASTDADGNEAAFLYKWNGSGQEGDDLYFNVSVNGATYTFTVESYLCGSDTDVYKAVKELKVGDKIDLEGFLYWYNGVNPHITAVSAAD